MEMKIEESQSPLPPQPVKKSDSQGWAITAFIIGIINRNYSGMVPRALNMAIYRRNNPRMPRVGLPYMTINRKDLSYAPHIVFCAPYCLDSMRGGGV